MFFLCIKLHLFLRKSKTAAIGATHFLIPICTKSFVGWGFTPDPTGGAYSAPPDALAVFWGPICKGRGGKGETGEGGSSSFAQYTHTHPFNGPLSGTTWVGRYQKGRLKPIWILPKQETVSGLGRQKKSGRLCP